MKTRIAYTIPSFKSGGAQTMLRDIATHINRNKFDICVFAIEERVNSINEQRIESMGIPIVYLSIFSFRNPFYKFKSYIKFRKALDRFRPDIIHCNTENVYSFWYAIHRHKKLICTIHSWPDRIVNFKLITYLKILSRRRNVWLVGCANAVSQRMIELLPRTNDFTTAIYNPIIPSQYYHKDLPGKKTFTFVHVGRLNPIKNQKLLLEAFSDVIKSGIASQLIICGEGELWDELSNECNELGISNTVKMLGDRSDIPDILAVSDAFVLSSNSECCPMVIIEAFAAGIPVITTDVGGTREVVGKAGICVEKGNRQQLANAMKKMVEDQAYYKTLADRTHLEIERFQIDRIVQQYENLYEKVYNE